MRHRTLTLTVGGVLALTGLGGTGLALAQSNDEERPSAANPHHVVGAAEKGPSVAHHLRGNEMRGAMRRLHQDMTKDPAMVRMHRTMLRDADMRRMHHEAVGGEG